MADCVDPKLMELIARNVVFKLINEHTLQSGLRSCDDTCSWLPHESRLVTCDQLNAAIGGIEVGDTIEDFLYNSATGLLTIRTDQGDFSVTLPIPEENTDTFPVSLELAADYTLVLTLNTGVQLTTTFQPLVDMVHGFTDKFLRLVGYNQATHTMTFEVGSDSGSGAQTFTVNLSDLIPITVAPDVCLDGVGTEASPLSLDIECLVNRIQATIPSTSIVVCEGGALSGSGTAEDPLCVELPPVVVCEGGALSGSGTEDDPLCVELPDAGAITLCDDSQNILTGDGSTESPLCAVVHIASSELSLLSGSGTADDPLGVIVSLPDVSGVVRDVGLNNYGTYDHFHALTSGSENIAIGFNSAGELTTGQHNILLGNSAGVHVTTGHDNTCIGHSAGGALTDGYSNVLIGTNAGGSAVSGWGITCLGDLAGSYSAVGSGDTCVGYNTYTSGGGNETAIGGGAHTSAANTVSIGNSAVTLLETAGRLLSLGSYTATTADSANLAIDVTGGISRSTAVTVTLVSVPASSTASGVAGQIAVDNDYLYVCAATNSWIRIAKGAW